MGSSSFLVHYTTHLISFNAFLFKMLKSSFFMRDFSIIVYMYLCRCMHFSIGFKLTEDFFGEEEKKYYATFYLLFSGICRKRNNSYIQFRISLSRSLSLSHSLPLSPILSRSLSPSHFFSLVRQVDV